MKEENIEGKNATTRCDICKIGAKAVVDGKTKMGPWANMCIKCYLTHGVGLGTGKGQLLLKGKNLNWSVSCPQLKS